MFGASVFPSTAATDYITAVSTVITDNLPIVLALVGFSAGLGLAFRLFNKYRKVRV